MIFREAIPADIPAMQVVRHAVRENMLSDPSLVTDADCEHYIMVRGKGWICETGTTLLGFAIADLQDDNIWALFVHPDHAGQGIGKKLHRIMMTWYFEQGKEQAWLSTAPATKAAAFYRMNGWRETGTYGNAELRFEISAADWKQQLLQ